MIHNISMKQQTEQHIRQAGVVSIIVATMMIIIVGLIVVAFAQVSRREQRESLDDQLSTQAYYAAETGVNAVTALIQAGASPVKKTTCPQDANYNFNYTISSTSNVAVTCLLVDPSPTSLPYRLSMSTPTIVPVHSADNKSLGTLTFTWNPTGTTGTLANCPSSSSVTGGSEFSPAGTWVARCPFGVLRADLVDVSSGDYSRTALLNNDKVSFMVPVASGGSSSIALGAPQNIAAVPASCTASQCSITFGTAAAPINATTMYLRLSMMYQDNVPVTIRGTYTDGSAFKFSGALALVDSTARAQDVVRRIVVSAPLTTFDNSNPMQALVSGDSACKRFRVTPDYGDMTNAVPAANCSHN